MMERCSNCLGCKWIPFDKIKSQRFGENCPSVCFYNFNTYSARGKFQLGQAILDGETAYTEQILEAVQNCTSCGACDVSCKICRYNLEPLEHNIALKADAIQKGNILPSQAALIESLKKEQTLLRDMKKNDRTNWLKGLKVKNVLSEKAEILFFPGCKYSYDKELMDKAACIVSLLQKHGADLGVLGDADMCCAARVYQMGFEQEFEQRAKANIALIVKSGVKIIVTPCGDCYHGFKRLYAKLGLKVDVLHITECLDRLISEEKLKFTKPVKIKVTYHDPCHLGRQGEPFVPWEGKEKKIRKQIHTWAPARPRYNGINGVYSAPRNILKAIPGIQLVEMERIREYSWCCGAGGGCSETAAEFSSWTANERMEEAKSTGAEAVVSACPWCERNFKNVLGADSPFKVFDIVDIVSQAV
jgi:Fe-S oxidoreductase